MGENMENIEMGEFYIYAIIQDFYPTEERLYRRDKRGGRRIRIILNFSIAPSFMSG